MQGGGKLSLTEMGGKPLNQTRLHSSGEAPRTQEEEPPRRRHSSRALTACWDLVHWRSHSLIPSFHTPLTLLLHSGTMLVTGATEMNPSSPGLSFPFCIKGRLVTVLPTFHGRSSSLRTDGIEYMSFFPLLR